MPQNKTLYGVVNIVATFENTYNLNYNAGVRSMNNNRVYVNVDASGVIKNTTFNQNITDCINTNPANDFQQNIVNAILNTVDFTAATHVFLPYTCNILTASDLNNYLQYYDGAATLTVAPTA